MPIDKNYRTHKILVGIEIIIISIALWFSSSPTALENNLNWPFAFFVLGILLIIKGIFFPCCKK